MPKHLRFLWLSLVLILGWCYSSAAFAVIEIEITKGADDARPIAIVPFEWQGQQPLPQDISTIVSDDLRRSGRFRPTPLADLPERPKDRAGVHLERWKAKGIESLVVGSISSVDGINYQVRYQLIDVFNGQQESAGRLENGELVTNTSPAVLLSMQATVNKDSMRRFAHKIADTIFEKLTGIRGAFATRIAYVGIDRGKPKPYELFVSDADGYNPISLVQSAQPLMSPAWSPDGSQLAYVSFENRHPQIFIQNVYTGARRAITNFKGINGAPAWSPDGRQLAVTLSKDGNPDIYLIDIATRRLTRLTTYPGIDTEASWSPDGQKVIFTSNRGGKPQVYQVNLSTRKPKRLTFDGNYNAGASFTADGKQMVLVHRATNIFHISVMDVRTGLIQPLTETQLDESPSIAPNGSMIIYATLSRGRRVLAAVSTDGRFRAILPASQGDVRAPAWSPYLD